MIANVFLAQQLEAYIAYIEDVKGMDEAAFIAYLCIMHVHALGQLVCADYCAAGPKRHVAMLVCRSFLH